MSPTWKYVDPSMMRMPPYDHQIIGSEALFLLDDPSSGRVLPGAMSLFDEPGVAKTKQVIDAACALFLAGEIDTVLVLAPGSLRLTWCQPEFGEIETHCWDTVPAVIVEYHSKIKKWERGPKADKRLRFIVTNYEYVRSNKEKQQELIRHATGKKTWVVFDESSEIKSPQSLQSKFCAILARSCARRSLLNGTPVELHPGDLWAQARAMDPRILNCPTYSEFKARYAVMGGFKVNGRFVSIVGWKNINEIQGYLKPYVLRRLKSECLDLPEKLPSEIIPVPLDHTTWESYCSMRDELVTWMSDGSAVSMSPQAATKVMRLAQITGGFVGGAHDYGVDEGGSSTFVKSNHPVFEVGNEKLHALIAFAQRRLEADPNHKLLVWCRFSDELERAAREFKKAFPGMVVERIVGNQTPAERESAIRSLDPRTAPEGPVTVFGNEAAGGRGLTLTACHDIVRYSSGTRTGRRVQAEDRVHRPGQVKPVSYADLVAVGPKGQRTIDAIIMKAHQNKLDLATMTTSAWVKELTAE